MPKDLSYTDLRELAEKKSFYFGSVYPDIKAITTSLHVNETYHILITNSILQGSKDKSENDQKALVGKVQGEIPEELEIITLLVLTYLEFGKIRLDNNPKTLTRCQRKIVNTSTHASCNVAIGSSDCKSASLILVNSQADKDTGISARWKLNSRGI
jgi:hypothetical protein